MSRRPLWADPVRRAGDVRRRLWSESPIPRVATRRVRRIGLASPGILEARNFNNSNANATVVESYVYEAGPVCVAAVAGVGIGKVTAPGWTELGSGSLPFTMIRDRDGNTINATRAWDWTVLTRTGSGDYEQYTFTASSGSSEGSGLFGFVASFSGATGVTLDVAEATSGASVEFGGNSATRPVALLGTAADFLNGAYWSGVPIDCGNWPWGAWANQAFYPYYEDLRVPLSTIYWDGNDPYNTGCFLSLRFGWT